MTATASPSALTQEQYEQLVTLLEDLKFRKMRKKSRMGFTHRRFSLITISFVESHAEQALAHNHAISEVKKILSLLCS